MTKTNGRILTIQIPVDICNICRIAEINMMCVEDIFLCKGCNTKKKLVHLCEFCFSMSYNTHVNSMESTGEPVCFLCSNEDIQWV